MQEYDYITSAGRKDILTSRHINGKDIPLISNYFPITQQNKSAGSMDLGLVFSDLSVITDGSCLPFAQLPTTLI
jgi:hypothetical protein